MRRQVDRVPSWPGVAWQAVFRLLGAAQEGTHDLKSLGSGGMRLGPVSLVRAVGRVIRSVVGGDSEDSHQHQHQQHHLVSRQ